MKYLIAGLPRSRTAWLSVFMSAGGSPCYHDVLARLPDLDTTDVGVADTCWMVQELPEKVLCVHRDPDEVIVSLESLYGNLSYDLHDAIYESSDRLQDVQGLHVNFYDINDRLEEIHTYLTDVPYTNRDYLIPMNIQNQESMEAVCHSL